MSAFDRISDELRELAARFRDGRLTAAEASRLNDLLARDPAALDVFARYSLLDSLLEFEAGALRQNGTAAAGEELAASADEASGRHPMAGPHLRLPSSVSDAQPTIPDHRSPEARFSVPGFLRRLFDAGRMTPRATALLWLILATVSALSLVAVVLVAAVMLRNNAGRQQPELAEAEPGVTSQESVDLRPNSQSTIPNPTSVARLTRVANCHWGKGAEPAPLGSDLVAGQQLHMESGLVQIVFSKGVELVLQGPAALTLESDHSVFLVEGRLTARLSDVKARGFTVRTPQSAVVDEGTEFGVDVAPGGDQNVHVFQGQVQFAVTPRDGKLRAERELFENQGVRMSAGTQSVTLLADTGEGFTRSIDQAGHDPHVIAYWRFEDQPVGTLVPSTRRTTNPVRGTVDSSGNGNDLFTWSPATAPRFSADVAAADVAQTGKANRGSLDNSAPPQPGVGSRDLYTKSHFSHASPIDLQKIGPKQWTIEASVRPAKLRHAVQVFVGRDGSEPWAAKPLSPRLGLCITKQDQFAIVFVDADGRTHGAIADKLALKDSRWYHVAATSDGQSLRLYVDAIDGRGYQLQATSLLPQTGSTALGAGSEAAEWSIGRGRSSVGEPGGWFQGWIDEVRISDIARQPSDFLFHKTATGGRAEGAPGIPSFHLPRGIALPGQSASVEEGAGLGAARFTPEGVSSSAGGGCHAKHSTKGKNHTFA